MYEKTVIKTNDTYLSDSRFKSVLIEKFQQNPSLCPNATATYCAFYSGPAAPSSSVLKMDCENENTGRFVRITKNTTGGGFDDMLILCEVEFYGSLSSVCKSKKSFLKKNL